MSELALEGEKAQKKRAGAYLVLARKYRPNNFDELIGQEILVQSLQNGFALERIAHAFMLSGVRGVGKTTTARLLARAFNYESDEISRPRLDLTPPGRHCDAIAQGRHMDVIEIDAASHTGIDKMREILDNVRYAPVQARFKIYIIDEVHMLSTAAFNGLLKTLEEPPEHVKFIFATTEVQKVPVTVLSRCQRFDLRRVGQEPLTEHFIQIAKKEGYDLSQEAAGLIVRAAAGSVRDGLSLLDQAFLLADQKAKIDEKAARKLLGMSDRSQIIDLLAQLLRNEKQGLLTALDAKISAGVEPFGLLQDLMELVSLALRLDKNNRAAFSDLADADFESLCKLVQPLSSQQISRLWRLLNRSWQDLKHAPNPENGLAICLIGVAAAYHLPDLDQILAKLENPGEETEPEMPASAEEKKKTEPDPISGISQPMFRPAKTGEIEELPMQDELAAEIKSKPPQERDPPTDLETLLAAIQRTRQADLHYDVEYFVVAHKFDANGARLALLDAAPADLPTRLQKWAKETYGASWQIKIEDSAPGIGETHAQMRAEKQNEAKQKLMQTSEVKAFLEVFPSAQLVEAGR